MRYDAPEELDLLNEIWELDANFTNVLCAQQKLVSKHRDGPKVMKRYDHAQTPLARTIAFETTPPKVRRQLKTKLAATHPRTLHARSRRSPRNSRPVPSPKPPYRTNQASTGHSRTHQNGDPDMRQRNTLPGGFNVRQYGHGYKVWSLAQPAPACAQKQSAHRDSSRASRRIGRRRLDSCSASTSA